MQSELLRLAKQGNPQAIATLMNDALCVIGIHVKAAYRDDCLHVLMESTHVLAADQIVPALHQALLDLNAPSITAVRVYGHQLTNETPIWSHGFRLQPTLNGDQNSIPLTTKFTASKTSLNSPSNPSKNTATPTSPALYTTEDTQVPLSGTRPASNSALDLPPMTPITLKPKQKPPSKTHKLMLISISTSIAGLIGWGIGWLGQISLQRIPALLSQSTQTETQPNATPQAAANLKLARQLSATAEQLLRQVPPKTTTLEVNQKLKTAITLLETIPPQTALAPQVKAALGTYRQRYSTLQRFPVVKGTTRSAIAPQSPAKASARKGNLPIQLELSAQGESWLQVTVDGVPQYEGVLMTGDRQTWTAKQRLSLRVGSAGSILASFNRKAAKPLGQNGEVLELNYSPTQVTSRPLL
jgi:hypothetical protein